MKKNYTKLILLITVVFLFDFTGNISAQNLLVNGDMEVWEADTLAGWTIHNDGISIAAESSIVHNGSSSAAVTITGDRKTTDFGQRQQIVADSGVTYILSVWCYNTTDGDYFAWVIGPGPGNYTFSSSSGLHTDNTIVGEWQNFTWQYTATTNDTMDVFFRFYNQPNFVAGDVIYIDDVSVTVDLSSLEFIENGDMEVWEADTLAGWTIHNDGISIAAESSIVHGGTYSAAVTITGDRKTTDFGQRQQIVADSGVTYNMSVWCYNTTDGDYFAWVIGPGPGNYTFSSSSGLHTDNTIIGEWQNFTWQYTATTNDTMDVFFRFYNQPNFVAGDIIYIDDVSVKILTASTDATLSDLTIEGGTVTDFDPEVLDYLVYLPEGTTTVPTVDAIPTDENATIVITPATDLSGDEAARTTTVVVTAEDGVTTGVYTIQFVVVTGIDAASVLNLSVYPVPASDHIIISGLSEKIRRIDIMDITGKNVKTIHSSGNETRVSVEDLYPGYYFIRVENRTLKFIKQ